MSDEDPLERLEHTAGRIADRATYEQANRSGLLWVHAVLSVVAGTLMLLYGTASTIEAVTGPWIRALMFAVGFAGGALLGLGLTSRPRSVRLEIAGLVLIAGWDAILCAGLAYAYIHQSEYRPLSLGDRQLAGYVVAYGAVIYAGLLALVTIHLSTLRRIHRSGLKL